jgi:hypothetical protein
MAKRKAPATLGPSRRAYTTTVSELGAGVSKKMWVKSGNSSALPNTAVSRARPRAERPYW